MTRRLRVPGFLLALLGLAIALAGCATNPVTGESEMVFMSPEREAALGRQAAEEVERDIGLVDDPALTAYVEELGQRLAAHSPRRDVGYRFFVADMPEPNAFALPGGYIYVSRGLLALANSEAELANVMGHEIGHVAARHAAQRETRALSAGVLSALGTVAAGVLGGSGAAAAASQLGQVAGAGYIASYGRDQERQADEVGQQLASQSGWDPAAMADFLTTLERTEVLVAGQARNPTFLDSHPTTAERVEANRARAATFTLAPPAPIAGTRAAFLEKLGGLMVGPDPHEGVFRQQRFLQPDLGFALEFPEGWKTVNQKRLVGAQAPRGDAVVVLEFHEPSGDPRVAASQWSTANGIRLVDVSELEVGGHRALHAHAQVQSQQGPMGLDLTWVAYPGATYRITGMTTPASFGAYAPVFHATAGSLRELGAAERASIHALVLRVATARAGESLEQLSQRSSNRWTLEQTAVANGFSTGTRFRGGERIKIAVAVPLSSR